MTEKEELLLALSILRKHNLPVSPILEYEINERLSKQIDVPRNEEEISIAAEPVVFEKKKIILSSNSIKERFETYLYNRKSQNTVKNYIGILNKPIRNYINRLVDSCADSIYSFDSVESVQSCILRLKKDEEFVTENTIRHNGLTASLNSYLKFIEGL